MAENKVVKGEVIRVLPDDSKPVGAGAMIQALATERDVEVELREERVAEEISRTLAECSFGWKANYGCCVSKAEGERRRREALEQARQRQAEIAREFAQLKAEYEAARANGAPNDTVRDARERGRGGRARARHSLSLSDARRLPPRQEENRQALWDAAKNGNTDAVRGYIAKGVNVNCKDSVRAPPPPRAYHGERGPSRAPLPAARALGRETTSFAIGALVQRPACPRRRGGHGGPGVAKTHFSRSRARARCVGARSAERSPRRSGARVGARAPFPPFTRARDAAARETARERGSSAEERNREWDTSL